MQKFQHQTLVFADFTLDLMRGCLLRGEQEIKLRPKSFEVLKHLVENSGRLVSKDELIEAVWPGTAVTDDSLVQCLIEVRRALGDKEQRLIKTVPRRGYLFEAEVMRRHSTVGELIYTEEVEGVRIAIEEGANEQPPMLTGSDAVAFEQMAGAKLLQGMSKRHKSAALLILATRLLSRRVLATSALVMLVVAALSYLLLFRGRPTAVSHEIKSIAVLPLENLSGDPAQDYFADGMTEALISNLAQIHALRRVISRTSVMRFKGSRKSLKEIAQELNVDAVIEGTVQRSGGRVRVTARLIPVATDSPLWARDYERDLSDVLKLQSEVARAVADEIRIHVTPDERTRLAAARNINPQAHEAYLLGRHHLRTTEEELRQSVGHFERAIQLVPDYAAAFAGLSRAWTMRGIWGTTNLKEVTPAARDAALKAVALDSQLPEAHMALSDVKFYLSDDWDWAGMEQDIKRALELDPNSAEAHRAYADLLMALERHDEAIREIQRAEQLDPFSSSIQSRFGRVLYRARKYEEAVPHLQRAIDLDPTPGNSMPYWILGELYTQVGRYDEAIASFKKAQSYDGSSLDISAEIAWVYARMGKANEARGMLAELKARTEPASFSDTPVARAYAALGDKAEAFKVLFRQVEERKKVATFIKADPPFDSLHSDPRWKELLTRMNLQ